MAKKKVGLDFGHGENTFDNGSKGVRRNGVGYEEHHFNATVGLIVDKRLKEHGFDTVVAQSAFKADVPLGLRTAKYNAENCDLVVSIHANASSNTSANGMGIFYWKGSADGLKFSKLFVKNFQAMTEGVGLWGGDGIWESYKGSWTNFHMVRETEMVACLLELGFMTNYDGDFEYIFGDKSKKFRSDVAEAIVKTVCDYFGVKYQEPKEDAPQPAPTLNNGDYKIQKGDTFYSIASDFKTDVDALKKANPKVNPRALQIGSYINIPNGAYKAHKIVKGDTLWGLSQKYEVSVDAIRGANKGIDVYALQIGDIVTIPVMEKAQPAPKPEPKPAPKPQVKFPLPTGTYKRGAKGEAVKQIQRALNAVYFKVGTVDGHFGTKTEDALKRFQSVHDAYHVDGVYGSRVRERLNQLLNK